MVDKKQIGSSIKLARALYQKKTGIKMTQEILAQKAGISRSFLGDTEKGRSLPTLITLDTIANACGVTLDFFVNPSYNQNEQKPNLFKDLDIEYIYAAKELKDKGLLPDEIRKLADVALIFKK